MERYLFLRKVFYFLELCEKRDTGSRRDLGLKLQMSESSIKRMINDLKDSGVNVEFDYVAKSYVVSKLNNSR